MVEKIDFEKNAKQILEMDFFIQVQKTTYENGIFSEFCRFLKQKVQL